jgi:hypothetical protein
VQDGGDTPDEDELHLVEDEDFQEVGEFRSGVHGRRARTLLTKPCARCRTSTSTAGTDSTRSRPLRSERALAMTPGTYFA